MSDDVALMSAAELAASFRKRRLSPVEATTAAFDRIRKLDGKVNAFCHLDEAGALDAARAAEARYHRGAWLSPIDGVPTTVKDLLLAKGWPTLRGSTLVKKDQAWEEDAPAVARLRAAGAVLLGKTTTPEYGWKGVTDSKLTGITRNPWNLARTPGGSSGGAAVAAALGMGALHIGTDGGGSIRIPAAFTGIFGIKASFGRVPAYPSSPFASVAHVGPMTRTVTDAALMLNVMAQPDMRDGYALPYDGRDWTVGIEGGVAGWRIGFAETINGEAVDPGVAAAVAAAVGRFTDLGAHVEPFELNLPGIAGAFSMHWLAGAATLLDSFTPAQQREIDPGLQGMAAEGRTFSATQYLGAVKAREGYTLAVNKLFERFDLILTPTLPITAFEVGHDTPASGPFAGWTGWTPLSHPFNLTRHPAASIPCGLVGGLPVGLQLVGPSFREDVVFRAARAFESVAPFKLPSLPLDIRHTT
jgi:aspartyl-tRNA(Asn)/glutamyl-tRNA(Gln) amidotransferase subunit A